MMSSIAVSVQSERDSELHQQVLTSLQQQLQHLHGDVDQLTGGMKHMSVSCTQVTRRGSMYGADKMSRYVYNNGCSLLLWQPQVDNTP